MKGIILAGGIGTRLAPLTNVTSKHLLPIYNKPMIYYPLSTLMELGIREVLIISTPENINDFKNLFGNGANLGLSLKYTIQVKPRGIAEAFILAESFIGEDNVALILGDNIFLGEGIVNVMLDPLRRIEEQNDGACIFAYKVPNPKRFGVVTFDVNGMVIDITEKPDIPKSNYCVTGLYLYDNKVIKYANSLCPSKRNELEITDINKLYLKENKLEVAVIDNKNKWIDAGTYDSLFQAGKIVRELEINSGIKTGNLLAIAYKNGWISEITF
ncbi:MAG: sugar phosphate nucleotidyltransferase [Peptostreptococcus sp.]|uniref:sugar nucleotidyltransferase n=1 Tax=Peptostreptococcus sp. TaxID=1262 RepID=UPI000A5493A3|nr:sugar phosphate nucleotidyltransferase [Peptostreptococcus sp.]MDU5350748.1 sugar phosphate nucleotidyltransferase [Peptostreptococcus sp.]MDU5890368.1 sugar phosphate nucleotidyltransferase [Peptostreptococcus sp.]MDU6063606.1 sugar phosphate nucleotidyltransferase [Anaerococcus sp.]